MYATLNSPTLLLNKNWQAIRVITLREAIVKTMNDRAKFLCEETFNAYSWEEWMDSFTMPHEEDKDLDLDAFGYNWINANRWSIRAPEIIIASHYGKVPRLDVRLTRKNVLIRDNFRCQYTGAKLNTRTMTLDHVLPSSRGGKTEWTNVVSCCLDVNIKKGNRTPKEAGLKLFKQPKRPNWSPLFTFVVNSYPESWTKFIKTEKWNEIGYWDVELKDD